MCRFGRPDVGVQSYRATFELPEPVGMHAPPPRTVTRSPGSSVRPVSPAGFGGDVVAAGAADDDVATVATVQHVVAGAAVQQVAAGLAE